MSNEEGGEKNDDGGEKKAILQRILEVALSFDRDVLKTEIRSLREKYPDLDRRRLADRLIRRARWSGAGVGFGTGLPANPWVSVPAAFADGGIVLRMQVILAAKIALLFDEAYFDDDEPPSSFWFRSSAAAS